MLWPLLTPMEDVILDCNSQNPPMDNAIPVLWSKKALSQSCLTITIAVQEQG